MLEELTRIITIKMFSTDILTVISSRLCYVAVCLSFTNQNQRDPPLYIRPGAYFSLVTAACYPEPAAAASLDLVTHSLSVLAMITGNRVLIPDTNRRIFESAGFLR